MDSSRKLPGNCQETAKIANHYVPPLVIRMYSTGLLFISVSFGKKISRRLGRSPYRYV